MNELDWTEGLAIGQTRVQTVGESECPRATHTIGGRCLPELWPEYFHLQSTDAEPHAAHSSQCTQCTAHR